MTAKGVLLWLLMAALPVAALPVAAQAAAAALPAAVAAPPAAVAALPAAAAALPAAAAAQAPAAPQTGGAARTGSDADLPAQSVIRETELDRQVKEVSSQLRCVVCQGLSIQDSPSTLAQEMRDLVREQLEAGRSPEEVKAYFVERYGEWVLLRPKASGFNLVVYLLPIAMILGGAAFIYFKARTWTRAGEAAVP